MSPRSNIYLWLIATILVAALTAWAVTQRLPSPPEASIQAPSGLSLHEWMHQHLEISSAQHVILDPLESAFESQRVQLRQQIRQSGEVLAIAIRDSAPDAAILALGADVPVCLAGRPARMSGVGEVVEPLSTALPAAWLVLAWAANLFNFMDGSDGLAGGMAVCGFLVYATAAWLAGSTEFVDNS